MIVHLRPYGHGGEDAVELVTKILGFCIFGALPTLTSAYDPCRPCRGRLVLTRLP